MPWPGMAELGEFVLEETVQALPVFAGDQVPWMAGAGEREVGRQIAAAAEVY